MSPKNCKRIQAPNIECLKPKAGWEQPTLIRRRWGDRCAELNLVPTWKAKVSRTVEISEELEPQLALPKSPGKVELRQANTVPGKAWLPTPNKGLDTR